MPFCSRQIMQRTLATLRERGFDYIAGLEVEFYITKLEDRKLDAGAVGVAAGRADGVAPSRTASST